MFCSLPVDPSCVVEEKVCVCVCVCVCVWSGSCLQLFNAVRGRLAPRSHNSASPSLSAPELGQANCFHASLLVYLISSFTIRSFCFLDTSKDIKKRLPPLLYLPFPNLLSSRHLFLCACVCQFGVFRDAGGARGDKERKRSDREGDVNSPIVSVC